MVLRVQDLQYYYEMVFPHIQDHIQDPVQDRLINEMLSHALSTQFRVKHGCHLHFKRETTLQQTKRGGFIETETKRK